MPARSRLIGSLVAGAVAIAGGAGPAGHVAAAVPPDTQTVAGSPPAAAATLVPLSGRGTPVLDGAWSQGEWDRAGRHDFTVEIPEAEGGGTARATILVMNDDANVYLATWLDAVVGCSFYPSFSFDSDGDGDPHDLGSDHVGGHVSAWSEGATELFDSFYAPGRNIELDTRELEGYPPAGTIDGAAAGGHPGGHQTFAEFAHPLDTADDAHDFSRGIGDSVRMTWFAFLNGGACGRCEDEGCTTGGFAPALGQFVVTFVPEDDVAPVMVGRPRVQGAVPAVLGKGSTLISWSAEDPGGTGVDVYRVEQRKDGGDWRLLAVTPDTEMALSLLVGHRYRYRVTPRDRTGNWGATVAGPAFTPVVVQDGSARVGYAGRWSVGHPSGAAGARVTWTTRAGATASITFDGYAIAWVTATGPSRGRVAVFIDGVRTKVIDLHAESTHWRRIRFSAAWEAAGRHTLRVRNLDGGDRVDVDAFVVYR